LVPLEMSRDQNRGVASVRSEWSGGWFFTYQRGINSSHQALTGGLFVARGAVDLAGEKQVRELLGFERAFEFGWVDRVVLDGIAGTGDLGGFETRNLTRIANWTSTGSDVLMPLT